MRTYLSLAAKITLIIGTYIFYGYENVAYLIPFVFATVCDMVWGACLEKTSRPTVRRWIVGVSVVQNLSLFFIFKYLNAVAATFPETAWLQSLHAQFANEANVIPLPPGISFYLFESLSFVIDCYRRKVHSPRNPFDFLVFISMFPRFIAGPIVRYADLEDSIRNYRGMRWADGFFIFMVGFILKVLLADSLAFFADAFFGKIYGLGPSWIAVIAYTFQLYIDFSAYSLMAIGLGVVLGFPFLDNFREPYISGSITEFWRRWHISLSTWLRDYLYIPLGGNRGGRARTYLNLTLTMVIGGIWHGASLQFLFWGAYHGGLLALERGLKEFGIVWHSRIATFLLVMGGWVFFRAASLEDVGRTYAGMLGAYGPAWSEVREQASHNNLFLVLSIIGLLWAIWVEPWVRCKRGDRPWHELSAGAVPWPILILVCGLFVFSWMILLSARTVPFLYFQF